MIKPIQIRIKMLETLKFIENKKFINLNESIHQSISCVLSDLKANDNFHSCYLYRIYRFMQCCSLIRNKINNSWSLGKHNLKETVCQCQCW